MRHPTWARKEGSGILSDVPESGSKPMPSSRQSCCWHFVFLRDQVIRFIFAPWQSGRLRMVIALRWEGSC